MLQARNVSVMYWGRTMEGWRQNRTLLSQGEVGVSRTALFWANNWGGWVDGGECKTSVSNWFIAFHYLIILLNHSQPSCRWSQEIPLKCVNTYRYYICTECPRRNVRDFRRVFLMLNYTDITQNTYIQSWMVTEIMAIEKCGLLGCPCTVHCPWRHTHPLCMPGNETS